MVEIKTKKRCASLHNEMNKYTQSRSSQSQIGGFSMSGKKWSKKEDELLLKYKQEGLSASQIGEKLGRSKNAVCGRFARLCKFSSEHLTQYTCFSAVAEAVYSLKPDQCRFPLGDPRDNNFRYCSNKALPGYSYCKKHASIAYVNFKK